MALQAVALRMTRDAGLQTLPRGLPMSGAEEPIGIVVTGIQRSIRYQT
jgi:hypothetical protein